jgi:tetratricopeptide (TPR) repeat protein
MNEVTRGEDFLEEARGLALGGDYHKAISLLEEFLKENGTNVPARRFLANIFELRAFVVTERKPKRLVTAPDYLHAREIYEAILKEQPRDLLTLNDLAEHFMNLGGIDRAVKYYSHVIDVVIEDKAVHAWKEELGEIAARLEVAMTASKSGPQRKRLNALRNRIVIATSAVE